MHLLHRRKWYNKTIQSRQHMQVREHKNRTNTRELKEGTHNKAYKTTEATQDTSQNRTRNNTAVQRDTTNNSASPFRATTQQQKQHQKKATLKDPHIRPKMQLSASESVVWYCLLGVFSAGLCFDSWFYYSWDFDNFTAKPILGFKV